MLVLSSRNKSLPSSSSVVIIMAVSHALVVAALLSSLLVCGRADRCAPDCRGGSAFFPHPQSCTCYYQCSSGTAHLQHCPEGLEFSFPGLRCDYPAQAGCTSDPANECVVAAPSQAPDTTEASPRPSQAPDTTVESPRPSQAPDTTVESPRTSQAPDTTVASPPPSQAPDTTVASPNTPTCAPECLHSGVYLAHPQDCSKFYICGGDGPVEFSCQQGLHYYREKLRCDYPDTFICTAGPHRACDEIL